MSAYTHQFWVSDQIWTLYHTVLVDSSPKILYACHPLLSCRIPFQCFCSWAHQGWSCASSQWDQQWLLSRDQRHVWSLYNPHPCLAVLDIMKRADWREILHIPRRQPATPWMLFLEDVITWKHVTIQEKKHWKQYELWQENLQLANESLDQSLDRTTFSTICK